MSDEVQILRCTDGSLSTSYGGRSSEGQNDMPVILVAGVRGDEKAVHDARCMKCKSGEEQPSGYTFQQQQWISLHSCDLHTFEPTQNMTRGGTRPLSSIDCPCWNSLQVEDREDSVQTDQKVGAVDDQILSDQETPGSPATVSVGKADRVSSPSQEAVSRPAAVPPTYVSEAGWEGEEATTRQSSRFGVRPNPGVRRIDYTNAKASTRELREQWRKDAFWKGEMYYSDSDDEDLRDCEVVYDPYVP